MKPDPITEAQALLQLDPLPADVETQLRALERQCNEHEAVEFEWLWEAYAIKTHCGARPRGPVDRLWHRITGKFLKCT